ncbi:capsular biosynthesis protein [Sinorhizobium americanum]|uniref:Capsule polysaccharide modification protein LipA n=1 Tax=Sinorhizobium americanum TaxID=194963 RepID=A0A1L3LY99_9HYPH|nr:capsular biosynthesis protein [Sinorhizobium americanum]APG95031.1 capsule polysaccharide modification protein LipA [Sinorhizobium americanum]OAP37088.1 capsular biosynthesis protein [Sinorhizobium americanum]
MDSLPEIGGKTWWPKPGSRLGATFFVRNAFPWLGRYFGGGPLASTLSPGIEGIISWGGRIPAKAAMAVARVRRLPHWHLEDGFLRSVGLGKDGDAPVSIIADDLALPVDGGQASRLELLIAEAAGGGHDALGQRIRERMVEYRLSKYNNLPHRPPSIVPSGRRRILLVDQVFGDVSVGRALGSRRSFDRMLDDALASGAQCVVRTHPDVMAGYRKGYITERAASTPGVILLADKVSVASILDVVDEVWTVSSQVGFDALLRGLPVRCYAVPFYGGWGLTEDRVSPGAEFALARRAVARPTADQITAAALGLYPSYRDPEDWRPMDVFTAMDLLHRLVSLDVQRSL